MDKNWSRDEVTNLAIILTLNKREWTNTVPIITDIEKRKKEQLNSKTDQLSLNERTSKHSIPTHGGSIK